MAGAWLACMLAGATVPVAAAPVAADDDLPAPALALHPAGDAPVDIERWVHEESTRTMSERSVEADRRALLQEGWTPRPPTWIQAAATVNLGDYPALDDSAEKAERDLQTLNWVLEQQRREAAARAQRRGDGGGGGAADDDRWFHKLLPQHWIPVLKANREWVVAGGTTMLLLVWGASAFARRPGATPAAVDPGADAAPAKTRRRRRHRRSRLQWQ